MFSNVVKVSLLIAIVITVATTAGASEDKPQLKIQPAEHVNAAGKEAMLATAPAGDRIVAVGDHGVILLSDDNGRTFHQARTVPLSSTLTGVSFADARHGWAVGHWGVILATSDGGDTWKIQRSDLTVDQPLFSVYFKNAREGWAVGLWSLMLHTTDGGTNWLATQLPPPPGAKKADRNLYQIFPGRDGRIFIAAEKGYVLSSTDGQTWTYLDTGYRGSLWAGLALDDGTLLVGGLRGTLLHSEDQGQTWQQLKSVTTSSITGLAQMKDKKIIASALDGVALTSNDNAQSFRVTQSVDRLQYTGVIGNAEGRPVMLSVDGPTLRLP